MPVLDDHIDLGVQEYPARRDVSRLVQTWREWKLIAIGRGD